SNYAKSVFGDDRATEPVVQTTKDNVGVTTGAESSAANGGESLVVTVLEDVIVFDANRPVGSEADFKAGTHGRAPAGVVTGFGDKSTAGCRELVVSVGDRSTTLRV